MDNQNLQKPNSNLIWAILTTLFCCLPFGIVAVFKAAQVDSHWYSGRYQDAYKTSKSATRWVLAAALTGLAIIIPCLLYYILVVMPFLVSALRNLDAAPLD